jgi:hypothetical protein
MAVDERLVGGSTLDEGSVTYDAIARLAANVLPRFSFCVPGSQLASLNPVAVKGV